MSDIERDSAALRGFVCRRCANCCRWPGFVRITDDEISAISNHLALSENDFIQRFARLRPQRTGLALRDNPDDGSCIFLRGNACAIQAVKPRQCREFPEHWRHPEWRRHCLGAGGHPIAPGRGHADDCLAAMARARQRMRRQLAAPLR